MLKKITSILIIAVALVVIFVDVSKFVGEIREKEKTDENNTEVSKETVVSDGFHFEVNESGGLTVKKYLGKDTKVVIPKTVAGKNVTEIGKLAFNSSPLITSVEIPDTVVHIQSMAFFRCSLIEEINIPYSVSEIEASAFRGCSGAKKLNFEGGNNSCLRVIGRFAFASCRGITELTLPEHLYSVDEGAFSLCTNLKKTNTGKELRFMGDSVFSGCDALTSVLIDSENCVSFGSFKAPSFCASEKITELVFADNVKEVGSCLATGLTGLKTVTFPSTLKKVGDYAFYGCTGLSSVSLPESAVSVGDYSFGECKNLSSIKFNEKLENIGNNALLGTSWYDSLEDGIIYMGNALFGIKGEISEEIEIVVKEGTVSIADKAFEGVRNAISVTLPKSIKRIGEGAFKNCTFPIIFTDLSSDAKLENIGAYAFEGYRGAALNIPASVKKLGEYAFSNCRSEIIFPQNSALTEIGEKSFADYSGSSVVIPSYITSIGKDAFFGTYADISFADNSKITVLGDRAFAGYKGFLVMIPDGVESIGYECFMNSTTLAIFGKSSNLKELSAGCYKNFEGSIVFVPKSVKRIDDKSFENCYSLVILGYYGSEEEYKKIDVGSRAYDDLDYIEIEYDYDYLEYIDNYDADYDE